MNAVPPSPWFIPAAIALIALVVITIDAALYWFASWLSRH